MRATSTEVQNNFGKYIQLAESQSIYIEKKGSDYVFKLEKVNKKEMLDEILENLYGCLKGSGLENIDLDEAKYQRIYEKHTPKNNEVTEK